MDTARRSTISLKSSVVGVTETAEQLDADSVRAARASLGWSRRQLAERLAVSYETVKSWETGRRPCSGSAALLLQALVVLLGHGGDR